MKVLLKLNGIIVDSTYTTGSGYYHFAGVPANTYTIHGITTKPWGGVNATDALKVERHFTGYEQLTAPVSLTAADVNYSGSINGTDALKIKRRFTGFDSDFSRGNWVFEKMDGGNTVVVAGADVIQDFYSLCTGDVNGNYIPAPSSGFICDSNLIIVHSTAGGVAPVNKTVSYGTVKNIPGEPSKCWTTSNLGADHQAISYDDATEASGGWYWQFNRKQGYKFEGGNRTPNTPWIPVIDENSNWAGANDPCTIELGSQWRVPTSTEWANVRTSGNWLTCADAWNSDLKLHAGGWVYRTIGIIANRGIDCVQWSSTQLDNIHAQQMYINCTANYMYDTGKSMGYPLRCVRNESEVLPTIQTTAVSNISQPAATGGGNVTSDGGTTVTARGVCWSTLSNPTLADSHTTDGTGTGSFVSDLTGLLADTTYHLRAYATNSAGTAYGNEITFHTLAFYIGQNYQGGIIFYIYPSKQHGLIAAPYDQGWAPWGCYGTSIPGTSAAIGAGQSNTTLILAGCPTPGIAARVCDDLVLNGYSDWFLPSMYEFHEMYLHKAVIGGFGNLDYWDSTENDANSAYNEYMATGSMHWDWKFATPNYIRAVRAF